MMKSSKNRGKPNLTDVKTEREGSASLTVGFISEKPSHQFYSDVPVSKSVSDLGLIQN